MTHRALELLSLPDNKPSFILDVGCGSGLSGEILEEEGHVWAGVDISPSMLGEYAFLCDTGIWVFLIMAEKRWLWREMWRETCSCKILGKVLVFDRVVLMAQLGSVFLH
jgi:18S rRNA (guanine1575-N7)-methyltransferase